MNRYRMMTEGLPVPAGQAERLKAAVLAAEPPEKRRVYRPLSFAKKALLAALAAAALTATVGAAASVDWSWVFTQHFGEKAASTDMAAELFQEVGVTAVCGDVTLTVREAVGDDHVVYFILDCQLPDTVDREELAERWREIDTAGEWGVDCAPTDTVTWEDIRGQDFREAQRSVRRSVPADERWEGWSGTGPNLRGYDPETNTLTWLVGVAPRLPADLTDWPLTILIDALVVGDEPLTDHPAIITFQPVNNARTVSGTGKDGETGAAFQVFLSPLALMVKVYGAEDVDFRKLYANVSLVFEDGTVVPGVELAFNGQGGRNTVMRFDELQDITDVCAVRIGDLEIPLS